jgi:integrase
VCGWTGRFSTRPAYRSKIDNYIIPAIGRYRLERLSTDHVRRLHDYIEQDLGLSATTALQAHRILAKALTDAEREGRVVRNVAKLVDAPKKAVVKISSLNNEQQKVMVRAAGERDEEEAARWVLAFQSGLRPGERLGLTVDEILFDRHIIRVAWQLQRLTFTHGCGETPCGNKRAGNCPQRRLDIPSDQEVRHLEGGLYLTRPKSRAGWREVPMTAAVEAVLRWLLAEHPPGQEGLVFTRDGHRPIDPSDDARQWKAALEDAGLPHVRRHSSRHTCATVLDELGVPDNVRQLIIGHADRETTALYTHVADERTHAAMAQLGLVMDYR